MGFLVATLLCSCVHVTGVHNWLTEERLFLFVCSRDFDFFCFRHGGVIDFGIRLLSFVDLHVIGFVIRPVLKHGPMCLTYVRLLESYTPRRIEID